MTATINAKNFWQYKIRLSLIAEQILAFDSHPNIVRVKNLSPNFEQVPWQCFTLLKILIWIVRFTLSLNSKTVDLSLVMVSMCVTRFHCLSHGLTVGSSFLMVLQNLVDFLSNSQISKKTNKATQSPVKKYCSVVLYMQKNK